MNSDNWRSDYIHNADLPVWGYDPNDPNSEVQLFYTRPPFKSVLWQRAHIPEKSDNWIDREYKRLVYACVVNNGDARQWFIEGIKAGLAKNKSALPDHPAKRELLVEGLDATGNYPKTAL